MRTGLLPACLLLAGCATGEGLRHRHGSPLYTYMCADGKTFQQRQILTGEIEVTAGGATRDATDADGDPLPGAPQLTYAGPLAKLTGMPGGPYESCVMDLGSDS